MYLTYLTLFKKIVYILENEIAKKYIFERCNQKQPITFESWLNPKYKLSIMLLVYTCSFFYYFSDFVLFLGLKKHGKKSEKAFMAKFLVIHLVKVVLLLKLFP